LDKRLQDKSLSRLYSHKTGILNAFCEKLRGGCDPCLKLAISNICNTSRLFSTPCVSVGSGAAWQADDSIKISIGEGIERYCGIQHTESLISKWSSYADLIDEGKAAIGPHDFPLFSDEQYAEIDFPFTPWAENMVIEWIQATSLSSNRTVWVPASFALKGYRWPIGMPVLHYDLFAGVACGSSLTEACLSALCEVVERDTLMLWWLLRLPLPRIDLYATPKGKAISDRLFRHTGLDFIVVNITLDWELPTVFAVVIDSYREIATCGCATRLDFWQASEKALFEAIQTQWAVRTFSGGQFDNKAIDPGNSGFMNMAFNHHLRPYMQAENIRQLREFLEEQPLIDARPISFPFPESTKGKWRQCLKQASRRAKEVLLVNLTTPDVAEAGLFVVRILIPGTVAQSVGPNLFLGSSRFRTISNYMGRRESSIKQFNHLPVPYI
jgi:ribosomal protein S12 methylthiotransferase accessory factor